MYDLKHAYYAASILGIDFSKFTPEEFLEGINIELEHGKINPKTNIYFEIFTFHLFLITVL